MVLEIDMKSVKIMQVLDGEPLVRAIPHGSDSDYHLNQSVWNSQTPSLQEL